MTAGRSLPTDDAVPGEQNDLRIGGRRGESRRHAVGEGTRAGGGGRNDGRQVEPLLRRDRHERDRLAADTEGDGVRRMEMRHGTRRGASGIHGGVHDRFFRRDVALGSTDLLAGEVDDDHVLRFRVPERQAARRDEERIRVAETRGEVPARRRHQPSIPGHLAEARQLLAQSMLLGRAHASRFVTRLRICHQAARPYAAASPGSAAPCRAAATWAATRIAS